MSEPTCGISQYVYFIQFGMLLPREIEPVAENLLSAIPGIEAVNVNYDWAELVILQEYLDELDDTTEFWNSLRTKTLEIADVTRTACLLYEKVGKK